MNSNLLPVIMAVFLTDSYDSTKYMCQVFYHKLGGINHWKATLAFFTQEKQMVENCCIYNNMLIIVMLVQNVNTVYLSEATGPTAKVQFKRGSNSSVKVDCKKLKTKEWNVTSSAEHDKVQYLLLQLQYYFVLGNKSCC